jgi:hypothetical protein
MSTFTTGLPNSGPILNARGAGQCRSSKAPLECQYLSDYMSQPPRRQPSSVYVIYRLHVPETEDRYILVVIKWLPWFWLFGFFNKVCQKATIWIALHSLTFLSRIKTCNNSWHWYKSCLLWLSCSFKGLAATKYTNCCTWHNSWWSHHHIHSFTLYLHFLNTTKYLHKIYWT